MKISQFNKRWHSPTNVFMHLDKLTQQIGSEVLEKSPKYQKAREARIAMIMAFVLSRIRNISTYLRLPLNEPPDVYLMQPNTGTMDIATVELTSYRPSNESLLEQLKRKKLKQPYPKEYILLVDLLTEDKVDYEAINDYAVENHLPFPIWSLRNVQQLPDTIAEVVIMNPKVSIFSVNVGEEAYYFREKYKALAVVFSKRVSKIENVRSEKMTTDCNIAPWENLED